MVILFIFALKSECPPTNLPIFNLQSEHDRKAFLASNDSIRICISGVGERLAMQCASFIANTLSPLYVVNVGSCGHSPKTHALYEMIQVTSISHKMDTLSLPDRLPLPYFLSQSLPKLHLETVSQPLTPSGYDCQDMEAYFLAREFERCSIPFFSLKIISDFNDSLSTADFKRRLPAIHDAISPLFHSLEQPDPPTISVIIPTYNRSEMLKRAIDSVLRQTIPVNELIVIDDGSSDDTPEVLTSYGTAVQTIRLPERYGVSYARNLGVKRSVGQWIAFLDSDDEWTADKMEHQVAFITAYPFLCLIESDERWIRHNRPFNKKHYHHKKSGWIFNQSLDRCMISPSAIMMPRLLLQDFPFDPLLPACEDYDNWLAITRFFPIGVLETVNVVRYGGHSNQLSQHFSAMDHFRVISLFRHIQHEKKQHVRVLMSTVFFKKCKILIDGAVKRNHSLAAAFYSSLMQSISNLFEPNEIDADV